MDPRRDQHDEARQIEHVRADLQREHPEVPAEVVARQVDTQLASFRQARVRSFVPVLVRRGVEQELRRLVRS